MSPGEIQRSFDRIDRALAAKVSAEMYLQEIAHINARITEVDQKGRERSEDAEKDTAAAVARAEKRIDDLAKATSESFKALDTRGQNSWGRVVTILGLVVSLVGLLWAVYASSKGIK